MLVMPYASCASDKAERLRDDENLAIIPKNSRSCINIPGCCERHPGAGPCSAYDRDDSAARRLTSLTSAMQMWNGLYSRGGTERKKVIKKAKGNYNQMRNQLDKMLLEGENSGEIQKRWREKARTRVAEETRRIKLEDYQNWSRSNAMHCQKEQRVGGRGDGGKWMCMEHIPASGQNCMILSIGSGGDFAWEIEVHQKWPHCKIHVFDGTNFGRGAPIKVPPYVHFHLKNFNGRHFPELDEALSGASSVDVLKIDCEGCEYYALMPFLSRVRVTQVLVELHGCIVKPYGRNQHLMRLLSGMYGIFHEEPNIQYSDGTCIEFGMLRLPFNATASTAYSMAAIA